MALPLSSPHDLSRPSLRRRCMLAMCGLAPLSMSLHSVEAKQPQTKVLFVCQYGSVKSAIAREVFKRAAAGRGLSVSAVSRGITPEEHLSAELTTKLDAEGIDTRSEALTVLSQNDIANASIVIYFDRIPEVFDLKSKAAQDWSDVPSMNNEYQRARSILDTRMTNLISELKARKSD